jgi:ubiquinone/menaquinone biosynthesis C-methylase UbiE
MQKKTACELAETMIDPQLERSLQRDSIPDYLEERYWWAYLHPLGLRFFEQQWVINAILWGNYARLRDAALTEMGHQISGRTLQTACVYGNLTPELASRHCVGAHLDVVDVAPIQLENLMRKLKSGNVSLHCQDAAKLKFDEGTFDQVLVFFLLHELPVAVRKRAISEVLRVLKPGGKLIFVDYHRPLVQHPLRYLMPLVFKALEPFALDLWKSEIHDWFPDGRQPSSVDKDTYFGGLYQKVVIRK